MFTLRGDPCEKRPNLELIELTFAVVHHLGATTAFALYFTIVNFTECAFCKAESSNIHRLPVPTKNSIRVFIIGF